MIEPTTHIPLTINGYPINFFVTTGIVSKVTKRMETHFNASISEGETHRYGPSTAVKPTRLNVNSSSTTITELWLNDANNEFDYTFRVDLSLKEGQKVSIVEVQGKHGYQNTYIGLLNHTTGKWQTLYSIEQLAYLTGIVSKIGVLLYFLFILTACLLGFFFKSWEVLIIGLGFIVYLAIRRGNKISVAHKALANHLIQIKASLIDIR